jgi:hypothetical protein
VPDRIGTTDPDGVDHGWVLQVTFALTIMLGAPLVALASLGVELSTWGERALFAVRVGAVVWFLTAMGVFLYARRRQQTDTRNGGLN